MDGEKGDLHIFLLQTLLVKEGCEIYQWVFSLVLVQAVGGARLRVFLLGDVEIMGYECT